MTRLLDRVAIVTGGGSGIGRAIAIAYAKEGADVVIVDVNLDGAEETAAAVSARGRRGLVIRADVSDRSEVEAMVRFGLDELRRVDILVNVAGVMRPGHLLETTSDEWDQVLRVNLRSQFLCLQSVGRAMAAQGSGSIINVTSVLGSNARPGRGAYSASKAGVIMLTKTGAQELGPDGVRVNAIAPGSIQTPMTLSVSTPPEDQKRKAAAIPLRRRGEPRDLVGPALFLASDESSYVTGHVLTVDGGMTAGSA
jgi:3-oxoacyl-[acyl-carrier protein] reductase